MIATAALAEPVYRDVSFRSLIVDPDSLQSRVGIDKEHEKGIYDFLVECIKNGLPPTIKAPIVFEDHETGELWLADGFHRVGALMKLRPRLHSYRMQIIEGTRRDAMLFSVSANLVKGALDPTPEDKAKAVRMLLADVEWQSKPSRALARKVGFASPHPVNKIRADFFAKCGRPLPPGLSNARRRDPVIRSTSFAGPDGHTQTRYSVFVPGSQRPIAQTINREIAEKKLREAQAEVDRRRQDRACLATAPQFINFLAVRNICAESKGWGGTLGKMSPAFFPDVFTPSHLVCLAPKPTNQTLAHAMGELLSTHHSDLRKPVIICYPNEACTEQLTICRHYGIEVMTPEEFVASVNPEPSAGSDLAPSSP